MLMLEETRNMLYAVWPHGCFARLIAMPAPATELIMVTPTQVGSHPSPTQVGMATMADASSEARSTMQAAVAHGKRAADG